MEELRVGRLVTEVEGQARVSSTAAGSEMSTGLVVGNVDSSSLSWTTVMNSRGVGAVAKLRQYVDVQNN